MKAAYYLAGEANLTRFDAMFCDADILVTAVATEKIPSLAAFIIKEKTIVQQDYIIIDVDDTEWTPQHILSAVQQLRRFSAAQLIFIAAPGEVTTELYGELTRIYHVKHLITKEMGYEDELRTCFQSIQPDEDTLAEGLHVIQSELVQTSVKTTSMLKIPDDLVIEVGVAGTMRRCGTTTQVFAIYHYLKSLGWRPAVLDKCGQTEQMLNLYVDGVIHDSKTGISVIHDIPFCQYVLPQYNAYVSDYGLLTPDNSADFAEADLSVLVGCTKPWELPAFADALKQLMRHPCREMITLANFSTPQTLSVLAKYFAGKNGLTPYSPDPWTPADSQIYSDLLLPGLRDLCRTMEVPAAES